MDYESIAETGGDINSGVIRILGSYECIIGSCVNAWLFPPPSPAANAFPCRLGTWRLLDIVDRVISGKSSESDLDLAAELAADIADGALCGLGRGSVRPLLTGLKFFRQDFLDHLGSDKFCSAERGAAI